MASYFVSRSAGLDTNPGTQALPFKTINAAVAKVAEGAGDSVFVEGNGNVYTEVASAGALTAIDCNLKRGIQLIGTGTVPPVLEGAGTQNVGINFPKNADSLFNTRVANFEIRNFRVAGINGVGRKGVPSNNIIENCHIHHSIMVGFATSTNDFARYQQGIKMDMCNVVIRNCHIHHVGYGGEAKGIWFTACKDALVENNDIHNIRKDGIRSGTCIGSVIRNNRFYLCQNGISSEQTIGDKIHNNFTYLNCTGLQLKHNNDPFEALNQWSMTADQWVLLEVYHNTMWNNSDQNNGLAWNFDPTVAQPERGAQWHVHYMNNLSSGVNCFAHIRDHPNIRKEDVFMDHNVYENRVGVRPLHFYRNYPADVFLETMAELTAGGGAPADPSKTLGWEEHGRFLSVDFEDAPNGRLNPITNIPGTIELPTPYGSQVGARITSTPKTKYQPNVVTVVSSKSVGAPTGRLIDEYGQQTSYDTNSGVDEWVIFDQGAAKPLNHFKWDVYGHQQPKSVKTYSLEIANSSTGPWTMITDHGIMNDNFGSRFLFEIDPVTARYVRFTANEAYDPTLNKFAFAGFGTGLLSDYTAAPPPAPVAPVNTVAPVITPASAQVGDTLTTDLGTWQGNPTSFRVEWLRDNVVVGSVWGTFHWGTGSWSATAGQDYVVTAADVGHVLKTRVTASNAVGPGVATSSNTVTPTAAPPQTIAPVNTAAPAIQTDGRADVGDTLSCTTGTWVNTPTSFTKTWTLTGSAPVAAETFLIPAGSEGKSIKCVVRASNTAGFNDATSEAVTVYTPPPPPPPPDPTTGDTQGYWGMRV